ncbi:tyrosine-type recombinase/integrase [Vreelandella alkaliphila]|uniref:tyrosine-type recombinase/integrase n=1 Tax=Vreelandella alkaliphila TaxID=272774 RepID=UPI0039F612C9
MPKLNFTKKAIDSLEPPPQGKRATYTDTKIPGLELRVTAAGTKTFSCQRWVKSAGRPERVTLGRYPAMTIEQARRKAMQIVSAIAEGDNPAAIRRQVRGEPTLAELFNDYLEKHAKKAKKTWAEDRRNFIKYVETPLGSRKLSSLQRRDFITLHNKLSKTAPIQANRVMALCSSVFGWAIDVELWETNPAAGIKKNRERKRDRFLQPSELPRFFQALAAEPSDTVRDFFLACLLTGARRSNVLAMRWEELELDEGVWRIPDTKNGEPQLATVPAQLVTVLNERRARIAGPWVFPGTGKKGHFTEPRKGWERILTRAQALGIVQALAEKEGWEQARVQEMTEQALFQPGDLVQQCAVTLSKHAMTPKQFSLLDLRIHDLRRTLGSWQAKHGASLAIIGKSLNHKSVQATAIYARLDIDPVRDSVTRAVDNLLAAGGVTEPGKVVPFKKGKSL